jgi:hypothetical protein
MKNPVRKVGRESRNRVFSENTASEPLTGEKPGFFDIYA